MSAEERARGPRTRRDEKPERGGRPKRPREEPPDVVRVIDTLPRCKPVERAPLPRTSAKTTLRALVRRRLDNDFALYQSNNDPHFASLVQPGGSTATRSGWLLQRKRPLDREVIEAAVFEAIAQRRILVALDGVARSDVDAEIRVKSQSVLEFVVLFPIVAG